MPFASRYKKVAAAFWFNLPGRKKYSIGFYLSRQFIVVMGERPCDWRIEHRIGLGVDFLLKPFLAERGDLKGSAPNNLLFIDTVS
ncbi:MAG: hypothetical protein LBD15_03080 [Holosporales bacterium]|nr:hypothetical protein [Holosporales bacterium]